MDLQKTQPDKKTAPLSAGNPESEIRQQINLFQEAVHDQDLDEIMSFYSPDVIAFDMMGPLQFVGAEAYRKSWQMAVETPVTNATFTLHNLDIAASDDVGFAHSLCHCTGTMKDGKKMDMWMRWTDCFEKIEGKWLITHEQVSVPIDMETNKALLDLKPEGNVAHS